MKLRTLLKMQAFYPVLAIAYLIASYWQLRTGGTQFSTADPLENILLFTLYSAGLSFGLYNKQIAYRIWSGLAIPLFGIGGVVLNILNFLQTGLDGYSSFAAWSIGTAINIYGLIWNIVAAIGAYRT